MIVSFETINERGRGVEHRTSAVAYPAEAPSAKATLLLAHGAGAPQQSAFMVDFARALAQRGIDVLTFNFLYTEQKRKVPDRTAVLDRYALRPSRRA